MLETEYDEAKVIAMYIKEMLKKKVKPSDIAILYRNNFIAISIEKELIKQGVPYKIFKGRSLLQKKAVQEFMNFVSLFLNHKNNVAIEACLTSTAKILSAKKVEELKNLAESEAKDLSDIIFSEDWKKIKLSKPQKDKLESFIVQTIEMRKKIEEGGMQNEEFIQNFYEYFPLIKEYERIAKESTSIKTRESAEKAIEDLNNIFSIVMSYKTVEDFAYSISLSESTEEEEEDKVNLMTIHSSKGLEFSFVFLARMNQGVIPSSRSLVNQGLLEEERRLAYVAITRAKKFLHISYIKRSRGEIWTPSQFLFESKILKKSKFNF